MTTILTKKACKRCHFTDVGFIPGHDVCVVCEEVEATVKVTRPQVPLNAYERGLAKKKTIMRAGARKDHWFDYQNLGLRPVYKAEAAHRIRAYGMKLEGIELDDLMRKRVRPRARHCQRWCYYATLQIMGWTLSDVAKFYSRDHSSIQYAVHALFELHEEFPGMKIADDNAVRAIHKELTDD